MLATSLGGRGLGGREKRELLLRVLPRDNTFWGNKRKLRDVSTSKNNLVKSKLNI